MSICTFHMAIPYVLVLRGETLEKLDVELNNIFHEHHQHPSKEEYTTMLRTLRKIVEEEYLPTNTYYVMCWWALNAYKYENMENWYVIIRTNYIDYYWKNPYPFEWDYDEPEWLRHAF